MCEDILQLLTLNDLFVDSVDELDPALFASDEGLVQPAESRCLLAAPRTFLLLLPAVFREGGVLGKRLQNPWQHLFERLGLAVRERAP